MAVAKYLPRVHEAEHEDPIKKRRKKKGDLHFHISYTSLIALLNTPMIYLST